MSQVTFIQGFHGKLPSAGDFVSRGLSPRMQQALDRLLQSAMAHALSDGTDPGELFARAPLFALVIRHGTLCDAGFVGVVVPSRDRVGRWFPLVLGVESTTPSRPAPASWPSRALTHTLCGLVIDAQSQRSSPDELWGTMPDPLRCLALASIDPPFANAQDETIPFQSNQAAARCFVGPEVRMSTSDRALCSALPLTSCAWGATLDAPGEFERFFALRVPDPSRFLAATWDDRWVHWGWDLHGATLVDLAALPMAETNQSPPLKTPGISGEADHRGGDPFISETVPVDNLMRRSDDEALGLNVPAGVSRIQAAARILDKANRP